MRDFPARTLKNPKTFRIEVGEDGFNAYLVKDTGEELFAASSSMSTWLRMMADMLKAGTGQTRVFLVQEKTDVRDSETGTTQDTESAPR